jgi:hypothetical protein
MRMLIGNQGAARERCLLTDVGGVCARSKRARVLSLISSLAEKVSSSRQPHAAAAFYKLSGSDLYRHSRCRVLHLHHMLRSRGVFCRSGRTPRALVRRICSKVRTSNVRSLQPFGNLCLSLSPRVSWQLHLELSLARNSFHRASWT